MADMINTDGALLRTDGLGRIKTPPQRREQLLDEFERSGVSGTKFAALAGIKYQTFAAWVYKRRRQREGATNTAAKQVDSVRWLEAIVEQAQNCGGQPGCLILQLPGGVRAEIADAKQAVLAAALVRALEKPC